MDAESIFDQLKGLKGITPDSAMGDFLNGFTSGIMNLPEWRTQGDKAKQFSPTAVLSKWLAQKDPTEIMLWYGEMAKKAENPMHELGFLLAYSPRQTVDELTQLMGVRMFFEGLNDECPRLLPSSILRVMTAEDLRTLVSYNGMGEFIRLLPNFPAESGLPRKEEVVPTLLENFSHDKKLQTLAVCMNTRELFLQAANQGEDICRIMKSVEKEVITALDQCPALINKISGRLSTEEGFTLTEYLENNRLPAIQSEIQGLLAEFQKSAKEPPSRISLSNPRAAAPVPVPEQRV